MSATRRGPCAACAAPIQPGEVIAYALESGPRHLACSDREPEYRRNAYRTSCALCGVRLKPGAGALTVTESPTHARTWSATCVDFFACDARIRADQAPPSRFSDG